MTYVTVKTDDEMSRVQQLVDSVWAGAGVVTAGRFTRGIGGGGIGRCYSRYGNHPTAS